MEEQQLQSSWRSLTEEYEGLLLPKSQGHGGMNTRMNLFYSLPRASSALLLFQNVMVRTSSDCDLTGLDSNTTLKKWGVDFLYFLSYILFVEFAVGHPHYLG